MKRKKWIFRQIRNSSLYFSGTLDWTWGDSPKDRPSTVESKYIYASEADVKRSGVYEEFPEILTKYVLVEVSDAFYKPISNYEPYCQFPPKIVLGSKNEYCAICGQNIIANEPYIVWISRKKICLHCVMSASGDIEKSYDKVQTKLKNEWKRNGKQGFDKQCSDFI